MHVWGQIIIKPAIGEKTSYQIFDIHLFACSSLTAKFANQGFLAAVIRSEMILLQCSAKRFALGVSKSYIDDTCSFGSLDPDVLKESHFLASLSYPFVNFILVNLTFSLYSILEV